MEKVDGHICLVAKLVKLKIGYCCLLVIVTVIIISLFLLLQMKALEINTFIIEVRSIFCFGVRHEIDWDLLKNHVLICERPLVKIEISYLEEEHLGIYTNEVCERAFRMVNEIYCTVNRSMPLQNK